MIKSSVYNNPNIYFWANLLGGISLIAPVSSLFLLHRGLVYSDFFVILILIVVSMFIFEVPTGAFADKYGPRASLIIGQLLGILVALLYVFGFNRWIFYFAAFLTGIAITFFSGCDEALIYDSLKETRRTKSMSKIWGKVQSGHYISSSIGLVIGAIIAKDLLEYQFIILIFGSMFFGFLKLFFLMKIENPKSHYKKVSQPNPFHHVKEGIKIIKKNPALLLLFLSEIFVLIPFHVFGLLEQPFLVENGVPVATLGMIFAISSLASFFALQNVEFMEKKIKRVTFVYLLGIFILIGYLIAAFLSGIVAAIAVVFILSISLSIRLVLFSQIKNEYIPSGSRATTLSLLSMIDSFFDVIIFASLGLISGFGLKYIFIGSAVIVFIGLLFPVKEAVKRKLSIKTIQ